MADSNSKYPRGLTTPVTSATEVTPNDSTDLADVARGLWVGTAGDISLIYQDDTTAVTLKNVPIGLYPFRAKRIRDTSTTATDIVALR